MSCSAAVRPSDAANPAPTSPTSAGPSDPVLEEALDLPEESDGDGDAGSRAELTEVKPALTWSLFAKAWNEHDVAALNAFRSQEGLLLLDNPGAFVRITHILGPAEISTLEGHFDRARLKSVRLDPSLGEGNAIESDCASDAKGAGTHPAAPARVRLKERWQALARYELASPLEIENLRVPVENAEKNARFAVYDLANHMGFLFAQEGQSLVLVAVDAVVPCSA